MLAVSFDEGGIHQYSTTDTDNLYNNIRLYITSCNVMLNSMCEILYYFFRVKEEKREIKETMAGQDLMARSVLRYVYMSTLNNNFLN